MTTAVGFKAHNGWASAVVLEAGRDAALEIVAKERVQMRDTFETAAVYHVGHERQLSTADAQRLIDEALHASVERASSIIRPLASSCAIVRAAILIGSGKPLPPLEVVLRSHPLVHTAEGELYRDAIARACEAAGIAVVRIPAKSLSADKALISRLDAVGKASGKPWTKEQRECALAAWMALASRR
jgi:hypothetical protein